MKKVKLIKNKCEIAGCNVTDPDLLQLHHIIPRTDVNCTNHNMNLAIICSNCHLSIHAGKLKIIGVYPSTQLPNARTLIYELDGKRNVDIDDSYVKFINKSFKI